MYLGFLAWRVGLGRSCAAATVSASLGGTVFLGLAHDG